MPIFVFLRPPPPNCNKMGGGRSLPLPLPLPLLLLLLSSLLPTALSDPSPEATVLLNFKNTLTLPVPSALDMWSPTAPPICKGSGASDTWPGITCQNNAVFSILLEGLHLTGTLNVEILKDLPSLRILSVINNNLSGPIPAFNQLDNIKVIFLSNNQFSGDIPDDFFVPLDRLKKLWLDHNAFTGPLPTSLSKIDSLVELHLENNQFSGELPDLKSPSLLDFSVSDNSFTGPVPEGLKRFKPDQFKGNPGLCGPPLDTPCAAAGRGGAGGGGGGSPQPPAEEKKSGGLGKIVFLVFLGIVIVVGLIVGLGMSGGRTRGDDRQFDSLEADTEAMEAAAAVENSQKRMDGVGAAAAAAAGGGSSHKRGGGSSHGRSGSVKRGGGGGGGNAGAELVMVNEERGVFGLPDLMKAAAEVLGNGTMGSAYKAVMGGGLAVAVKRMRELNRVGKDAFDAEMRKYGRLRHRNVLPPLAYLYRRDEKLVVSEYVTKGSLLYILHGDRGPDHAALDWPTRLKIIRGITSGMAFLHAELAALDVPHGNFKSGNILLSPDYEPLIVDYGFISLVNPNQVSNVLFAYKSPEFIQHSYVSPKSDVYCLGIVILEILTGKFPSQYLNNTKGGTDVVQWAASAVSENREAELLDQNLSTAKTTSPAVVEDMVKLLRIATACTNSNPEKRPELKQVAELAEEIARRSPAAGGAQKDTPSSTVAEP